VKRLRDRLLAAVSLGLAGCAADAGTDVAIPAASGPNPTLTVAQPESSLERPRKTPEEESWEANGSVCMPTYVTNQNGKKGCGDQPGSWIWNSRFASRRVYFSVDEQTSRSESASKGGVACCFRRQRSYPVEGRPLEGEEEQLVGEGSSREGWCSDDLVLPRSRAKAERWRRRALEEHASVASFARLVLELVGLGAPAWLVRRAHEAALQEVEHARLSFEVASAFAGRTVGPGRLPVARAKPLAATRAELLRATLHGGCIGETLAAVRAAEGANRAGNRALRSRLVRIAREEESHAELAFAIAAWAIGTARPDERPELEAIVHEAMQVAAPRGQARVLREVVHPALRALAS
jgi:hypothetical protein